MFSLKKILEVIFVIALVLFSFYYTEKAIVILEANDPLMKQIKATKSKNEEKAINAKINDNQLIPGYNGLEVNLEKSFRKMKSYGGYNESLLVFDEVSPTISIEDYYDKYISSGNGLTTNIALVFAIYNSNYNYGNEIINILKNTNTKATFFIDGIILDNNLEFVNNLLTNNNEVELLSYDNNYDQVLFEGALGKLRAISNINPKYCYATYDNEEILNLCSKLSMHTIIPTLKLDSNIYINAKGNIRSGSIISISLTKNNINEVAVLINYIKQRGFTLVTLDDLLNEARYEK